MERVIVDTSVFVAVERGQPVAAGPLRADDDAAYAAITAAELLAGVHRAQLAQRAGRLELIEARLAAIDCLPYDLDVARAHAELLAHTTATGTPRGAHDLIIAATAKATGRQLITLDRRGFEGLPGVRVRVREG